MNLSTGSGLRPDAISAAIKCPFLEGLTCSVAHTVDCTNTWMLCTACDTITHGFLMGVLKPEFTACVYTPIKRRCYTTAATESLNACGKTHVDFRREIWDFPGHLTFGQSFLAARD